MWIWLIDQVAALWSWINSIPGRIAAALAQAVATAWTLYWRAVAAAQALVGGVTALAWTLYTRAVAAAQALVGGVTALAWTLYTRAVAAAQALVGGVRSLIYAVRDSLLASAHAFMNNAIVAAGHLADAAAARVRDLLSPQIAKALNLLDLLKVQLTALLADPASWLMAYLAPFLLWWLLEEIAYSLGAVATSLPPRTQFFAGGTPGGGDGGPPPPVDVRGLARPLRSIYVSGYRFGASHHGVDLGLASGDAVFAMHAGTVQFAGPETSGFGIMITLAGGDWRTLYAHLERVEVAAGQTVAAGAEIARGDSTGRSTGPHLHLQVWYRGALIDPLSVMP